MKWLRSSLDALKDVSAAQPMQCPRGWGEVCFQLSLGGFPPFFDISHKCPIGGVSECVSCHYPVKPEDAQQLRRNLEELDSLRKERVLSELEYAARRRMIVGLVERRTGPPGEGCRITAWLLGPVGVTLSIAGVWLATTVNPEFWVMAGIGMTTLALSISFAAISLIRRPPRNDNRPPRDPSSRQ
jgi:hypothetical protein